MKCLLMQPGLSGGRNQPANKRIEPTAASVLAVPSGRWPSAAPRARR